MTTEPIDRILRLPAVLALTGLTRSTLYRKIKAGSFPRQVQLSYRCAGWRESALRAWMHNPMFYDATEASADPQPRRPRRPSPGIVPGHPNLPLWDE